MQRNGKSRTRFERVIHQISDLRELGRRLFIAGHKAGLHPLRWTDLPPVHGAEQLKAK